VARDLLAATGKFVEVLCHPGRYGVRQPGVERITLPLSRHMGSGTAIVAHEIGTLSRATSSRSICSPAIPLARSQSYWRDRYVKRPSCR